MKFVIEIYDSFELEWSSFRDSDNLGFALNELARTKNRFPDSKFRLVVVIG